MVKATKHHLKDLNKNKKDRYFSFLSEYDKAVRFFIDEIWKIKPEDLCFKRFYNYNDFHFETKLSKRALNCACNQALKIIKCATHKERKKLWIKKNKDKNIKVIKSSKPNPNFINPLLSSKCCDFYSKKGGKFYGFIRLKCIGSFFGHIFIPINKHPKVGSNRRGSVLLNKNFITLYWEESVSANTGSKKIGADQGIRNVISFSDGQKTPTVCPHGHSMETILTKISRKRKGSKSFKRAQEHRKNFINWSINKLNFNNIKELRLEKIKFSNKKSKYFSHWTHAEIREKMKRRCEELDVLVVEQQSAFRSQRCSQCGQVRKANRKNDKYCCKNCGLEIDSDINAALNHEIDLPPIPYQLRSQKKNLGNGFFWKQTGIFNFDGSELLVPNSKI